MEVEESEKKQNQRTERLIELQGEMEGKDLQKIEHPSQHHPLELRRITPRPWRLLWWWRSPSFLQWIQGTNLFFINHHQEYGEVEAISMLAPTPIAGFYCTNGVQNCPPKSSIPLTRSTPSLFIPLSYINMDATSADGFVYRCSSCDFDVHVRCASMVLRIQERVNKNKKIHQHSLMPLEMEAQFLCAACDREHKGKSCLCPTCGFWANQICASSPTTIYLHRHAHPLALFRSAFRYYYGNCKICNEEMKRAYWALCLLGGMQVFSPSKLLAVGGG
ncbi:uncharacterized protein LOC127788296 [Diospyros lotus]|uniref:uncharacterized protein LOC127788296 n=1 Tax=Diospyros lotus TaxID=55363 RepID=UPI002258F330|nr:uncharacterized protein LOC127788296 [Diospyros lotus]